VAPREEDTSASVHVATQADVSVLEEGAPVEEGAPLESHGEPTDPTCVALPSPVPSPSPSRPPPPLALSPSHPYPPIPTLAVSHSLSPLSLALETPLPCLAPPPQPPLSLSRAPSPPPSPHSTHSSTNSTLPPPTLAAQEPRAIPPQLPLYTPLAPTLSQNKAPQTWKGSVPGREHLPRCTSGQVLPKVQRFKKRPARIWYLLAVVSSALYTIGFGGDRVFVRKISWELEAAREEGSILLGGGSFGCPDWACTGCPDQRKFRALRHRVPHVRESAPRGNSTVKKGSPAPADEAGGAGGGG